MARSQTSPLIETDARRSLLGMRTPALFVFVIAAAIPASSRAETINLQCRYVGNQAGDLPESVRSVVIDTTTPSITLWGTGKDATSSNASWIFRNNRQLGDVLTVHANGDRIAGAAIRIVAHGFSLNRRTGGFVWAYTDDKGPMAYRFICR